MKRSIEYIEKIVCAGEGVDAELLHAPREHRKAAKRYITDTMQIVMTLATEFGNPQLVVEKYFERGHPCAINARNMVNNMCAIYKEWDVRINVYRNIIASNGNFGGWDIENRIVKLRKEALDIINELNSIAV